MWFSCFNLLDYNKSVLNMSLSKTNEVTYRRIDLRSDTATQPTSLMRKAMAEAVVGDDTYSEDPTVLELERKTAELFGKEAAIFVPSGTMCNVIAVMVHCDTRSCEIITGDMSHQYLYEQGGASQLAGVQHTTLKNNDDGTFDLKELQKKIQGFSVNECKTKLVVIENTHGACGGKVLPLSWIKEVSDICKKNNLVLYMDGARIFHAAEYLKVPVSEMVKNVDTVSFSLSKGLSAPVGSILLGTKDFIVNARRCRKVLGGGLGQVGILAAAGIVALDTVLPILGETHTRLYKLASAVHSLNSPLFKVNIKNIETNIMLVHLENPNFTSVDFEKRLSIVTPGEIEHKIVDGNGNGIIVKCIVRDLQCTRFVMYLDITVEDVDLVIKKITFVVRESEQLYLSA